MAQTTGAMSYVAAYFGFSTDGSTWTDGSGYIHMINVGGGERATAAGYTADGDTPIITSGKRGPVTLTMNGVYTEAASELYDTVNDQYETAGGGALYIRWSPGGGGSGDLGFTSSVGVVKNPVYPPGDSGSPDMVPVSVVLECASVTESTIGTAGW